MKRIFAAIDISSEAREKASEYIDLLRTEFSELRVGWEKIEKLHLTLKFFGDLNENWLPDLLTAAEKTSKQFSAFELQIHQTGVFPAKRNARVLWLGLKDQTENLQKLSAVFESECAAQGFDKETRDFTAHLTVARLREPQKSKLLVERHLNEKFEPVAFKVSEIVIYESRLERNGSIYSVVSKHSLNGNE